MPVPKKREKRQAFVDRFMKDREMRREYPDQKQRAAVAYQQWRDRRKKRKKTMAKAIHSVPSRLFLAAKDVDVENQESGPAKFKMTANTGRPMKIRGYYDPIVVDLKGLKFKQKMPLVEDHEMSKRIGHTTSVKAEKDKLAVEGLISATGAAAQEVLADARNGFPFQASIGADVTDAVYLDKGQSTTVNGNTVKGPAVIARKAELYEVTVTAAGADNRTSFSVAASADGGSPSIGVCSMNFEEFLRGLGLDKDSLSEEQLGTLQAKFEAGVRINASQGDPPADPPPADPPPDDDDDDGDDTAPGGAGGDRIQAMRRAEADEGDRLDSIREISERKEFKIVAQKDRSKLRKQAVNDGWSPEKFELELHRARRPEPSKFAIHVQADMSDRNAVEAALLLATGRIRESDVGEMFDEKTMNLALSKDYRGYGLHRLMHETIIAAGEHYRPGQYDNGFIRAMKVADMKIRAAGDFSTVDVTGILSNIQNKLLLQSFTSTDQTLFSFTSSGSVKDFKQMTGYRMTGVGEFQLVPAGGEIKDMSLSEESYAIQADTFGAKLTLSRTQIINDDLGAFARVPQAIGRAAKMKLHDVAYNEFLDDSAFFTAGNNNLLTGADSALSIEALTAAVQAFMRQVDINEKPVDLIPAILLTGTYNAVLADQLFRETRIIMETHATGTAKARPANNAHAGKYKPESTRWTDADVASGGNGSDTAWWLLTDEPDAAVLEIRYLNGVSVPTIEEQDTAPDVLGMLWIGYFDFGVSKKEFRGGVKSAGV